MANPIKTTTTEMVAVNVELLPELELGVMIESVRVLPEEEERTAVVPVVILVVESRPVVVRRPVVTIRPVVGGASVVPVVAVVPKGVISTRIFALAIKAP